MPRRHRWKELEHEHARRGWVAVLDFVKHFGKSRTARLKRRRGEGGEQVAFQQLLAAERRRTRWQRATAQMAKLRDLRRLYPDLEWRCSEIVFHKKKTAILAIHDLNDLIHRARVIPSEKSFGFSRA